MTIHVQLSFSQGTFRQLPINSFSYLGSTFITYSYATYLSVNWTISLLISLSDNVSIKLVTYWKISVGVTSHYDV